MIEYFVMWKMLPLSLYFFIKLILINISILRIY